MPGFIGGGLRNCLRPAGRISCVGPKPVKAPGSDTPCIRTTALCECHRSMTSISITPVPESSEPNALPMMVPVG